MTEYAKQRRQQRDGAHQQEEDSAADLRNGQLDEDVACCLAEIDELLDAEQAEREQAEREFNAFGYGTPERVLNIWQAKYAHLGLRYGWCCGQPYLIDDRNEDGN